MTRIYKRRRATCHPDKQNCGHGLCPSCYSKKRRLRPGYDERRRSYHLRAKYGLTPEAHAEMFDRQGGTCFFCDRTGGKKGLHIDHDHRTGEIRGLLCQGCNMFVGYLEQKIDLLPDYLAYIRGSLRPATATTDLSIAV